MKYTYLKMIRDFEKKVSEANLEVHAVKWMFFNSDLFCGYSNLNNEVNEEVKEKFAKMVDRYINELVPPQYILNKTFFFNYPFYVDEGCFIPRPETEQLVEETIYRIDDLRNNDNKHLKIADVCCGSGAIGITLKKEIENCDVFMCELSSDAVNITKKNAASLDADVTVECGDFINPILEKKLKFDVLLCNPPYIKNSEVLEEMVVGHEPNMALFGGVDGLDFYRIIFAHFDEIINDKGFMGFEFGYDQKELLEELVKKTFPNYKYEFLKDYNKLYRMLFIYKN